VFSAMRASFIGLLVLTSTTFSVALLLGCAHANSDQLTRRASFDLGCSADQIQVYEIDNRTRGVVGCGQRVTYVESCDGRRDHMMTECTWVMNSDPRAVQQ
jgi:hypothetical protein